mgnify:CR=1 FL=1
MSEPQPTPTPMSPTVYRSLYSLPCARDIATQWTLRKTRDFKPTPRQAAIMQAVQNALVQGLFYTDEVVKAVAQDLGLSDEQLARQTDSLRVEGGDFGMDCYYARRALDARHSHAEQDQAAAALALQVGDELGTLMFNDFKVNTGCRVVGILGHEYSIQGKRGRYSVTLAASALNIRHAIGRAFDKAKRHDNYPAFCTAPRRSLRAVQACMTPTPMGFAP